MSELEKTFIDACKNLDLDKVRACVTLGVDVNCEDERNNFGLLIAITLQNLDLLDILLSHPNIEVNKRINIEGYESGNPFLEACWNGNADIVRRLLSVPGIDLNYQDSGGRSGAMWAVRRGKTEVVKLLKETFGIDWNLQSSKGTTAVMRTSLTTLKILKDIPSINWNLVNDDGHTALSAAMRSGNIEAVRILLSIPSLIIDANQLKNQNVPRNMIKECMDILVEMSNRTNNNMKNLVASLGDGRTMECPVCLTLFTAQRRVFMCGNGHFTCGHCKERIEVTRPMSSFPYLMFP